jgi:hypothetical protein
VLLLVYTMTSRWRVDTDWRIVMDSDYQMRAYETARLVEGEPLEFVWAPGPLGEQRRTHSSGPVLEIVDEADDELAARLFWQRVRTGNEPMRW